MTLSAPPHDEHWANSVCRWARKIHECIWIQRPNIEIVREGVLPVLQKAAAGIRKSALSTKRRPNILAFATNVEDRIANLERYVRGEPSDYGIVFRKSAG